MKSKVFQLKFVLPVLLIVFNFSSFTQEFEKNRINYRNFILNSDSLQMLVKQNTQLNKPDINPSFPVVKEDFMVNTLAGQNGCEQSESCTAIDGQGNRFVVWIDRRNEKKDIYAQLYDANGNKRGKNFKVNIIDLFGNNSPSIAANDNGIFVVTYLVDMYNIVAQKFNYLGEPLSGNIYINTTTGYNPIRPGIAVNNDGSFMVVWASTPNWGEDYTLFSRLVDKFGNPVGSDIIVNESDKKISSTGLNKNIAVDSAGNYCITWSSYKGPFNKVYLQIINQNGQLTGNNILVSDTSDTVANYYPIIVSVKSGNFLILWNYDYYPWAGEKLAWRVYNVNSSFITDIKYDSTNECIPYSISTDRKEVFFLLYDYYHTIKVLKIRSDGVKLGEPGDIDLTSSGLVYSQYYELSDVINNKLFVSLIGYHEYDPDIYERMFDTTLTSLNNFTKVNDDQFSSAQKFPTVAYNKFGQSIILWEDQRDGKKDLYAQVYDENYQPINGNIKVNDQATNYDYLSDKQVKAQSDGTFIIAFCGTINITKVEVYLQPISKNGLKVGNNIHLESEIYNSYSKLAMNIDENDELQLCWYNNYEAFARRFNKNFNPLNEAQLILKFTAPYYYDPVSISIDKKLNLFAVWKNYDYLNQTYSKLIYGRFFNKNGTPASSIMVLDSTVDYISDLKCQNDGLTDYVLAYKTNLRFIINRNYDFGKKYSFADFIYSYDYGRTNINILRFENHKLFLTFNKYDNVTAFYANDNKHNSKYYQIYRYPYINYFYNEYNGINSADIFNDNLLFAYESNQYGGTNSDIWANVQSTEEINFDKEYFYEKTNKDVLYNIFPNPFNSKTKIVYEVLAYQNVKLAVYDVLGREVKVLVDENQDAGLYELVFDASDLASGIYFLRLDAFDTSVKKMIILK